MQILGIRVRKPNARERLVGVVGCPCRRAWAIYGSANAAAGIPAHVRPDNETNADAAADAPARILRHNLPPGVPMQPDGAPGEEKAVRTGTDVKRRTRHTEAVARCAGERLCEEPPRKRI